MKWGEWLLIGAAFVCIPLAASQLNTGSAPARIVKAGEHLVDYNNFDMHSTRVRVTGEITDVTYHGAWTFVLIRDAEGQEIQIQISPEAGNNSIVTGGKFSFEGEPVDEKTVAVTLPGSINRLKGKTRISYTYGVVRNHVAAKSSCFGAEYYPAPSVPDGEYRLKIVEVDGGGSEAMLP